MERLYSTKEILKLAERAEAMVLKSFRKKQKPSTSLLVPVYFLNNGRIIYVSDVNEDWLGAGNTLEGRTS